MEASNREAVIIISFSHLKTFVPLLSRIYKNKLL
jgi:hypothetical protein